MHRATACLLVCATACAGRSSAPLASSMAVEVDPLADVVIIPPDVCPKFSGQYALTEGAVRQLLDNEVQLKSKCAMAVLIAQGEAKLADEKRAEAERQLASAAWWNRYGPIVAVAAALVSGGAVGGAVFVLRGGR